jgi:hypothetical protein
MLKILRTDMRQSHVDFAFEPVSSNVPGILAAFVIGMVVTFAGALTYSSSQQRLHSVAAMNAAASRLIAAPAQHLAPAGQEPVENSTGDQQEQAAATNGSTHKPPILPDRLSKGKARSEMRRPSSPRPNMPTPPPTGSVALAQNAPPVLTQQHRDSVSPQTAAQVIAVQPGARIRVRLAEALSSDHNRAGDTFRAVIDSPVVVNGFVVALAGANVLGRIANARKARLLGGRADLTLTLTDITTTDRHLARITTNGVQQVGAHSGIVNTAKMATGAAIHAVTGVLDGAAEAAGTRSPVGNDIQTNRFFKRKRTVVFPAGTQVVFTLAAPLIVAEQVNQ